MGKKKVEEKTSQQQQYQNTFGEYRPTATPEMLAVQGMKASPNQTIPYHAAARREEIENSYDNPLGAHTSPAVRDAVKRSTRQRFAMDEAQAIQESQQHADAENYGRAVQAAMMTAPQLIQTGGNSSGSGTGTKTESGGFWRDLAIGVAGGAAQGLA